jgi:hypothetical protein
VTPLPLQQEGLAQTISLPGGSSSELDIVIKLHKVERHIRNSKLKVCARIFKQIMLLYVLCMQATPVGQLTRLPALCAPCAVSCPGHASTPESCSWDELAWRDCR